MEFFSERLFDSVELDWFGTSNEPGVYAVCVKKDYSSDSPEKIIYIGSSGNIKKRVSHTTHPYVIYFKRYPHRPLYVKEILTTDYINLERQLISVYKPLLNKQNMK